MNKQNSVPNHKKELHRSNSQNKKSHGILSQRNQSLKDTSVTRETQQSSYFGDEYLNINNLQQKQKLYETIQRLEVENNEKDLAIEKATQIIDVLSKDQEIYFELKLKLENATNELQKLDQNRQELKDKNKQLEIENNDLNQIIEKLKSEEASLQTASFENDLQQNQNHPNFNSNTLLSGIAQNNLLNLSTINRTGYPNTTIQLDNNSVVSDRFYNEEKAKINQMIDEYDQIIDELNHKNQELEHRLVQAHNSIQSLNQQLFDRHKVLSDEQMRWKKDNDGLKDKIEKLKKILSQNKVHLKSYQLSVTTPLSKSRIRSGFYANNDYLLNRRNERSFMEQSKSDISLSEIGTDDYNNTFRNSSDMHSLQSTQKFNSPIFRIREEAENEEETSSCRNSKMGQYDTHKQRGKSQQPNSKQELNKPQQRRSFSLNSFKNVPQQSKQQQSLQRQDYDIDIGKNQAYPKQLQRNIRHPHNTRKNQQKQSQNIKVFDEGQIYSNREDEDDEENILSNQNNTQESREMPHQKKEIFFENSPQPFNSAELQSLQNSNTKTNPKSSDEMALIKAEKFLLNTTNPSNQDEDFDKEVTLFEKEFQQELERREQQLLLQFEDILGKQIDDKNSEIDELKKKINELQDNINSLQKDIEQKGESISSLQQEVDQKEEHIKKNQNEQEQQIKSLSQIQIENESQLKKNYDDEKESILNKLKESQNSLDVQTKVGNDLNEEKRSLSEQIEQMKKKLEQAHDSLMTQNNTNQLLLEQKQSSEQQINNLQNKIKYSEDTQSLMSGQYQLLVDQKIELEKKLDKQQHQIQLIEEQKANLQDLINEKNILIEQNQKTISDLSFQRDSQIKKIENQVTHFEKEFHEGLERRDQKLLQQFEMNQQIGEKNHIIDELKKKIQQNEETISQLRGELKVKENLLNTTSSDLQEQLSLLLKSQVENELALKKRYEQEIDQIQNNIRKQDDLLQQQTKQNIYLQEKKAELEKNSEKQNKQMQLLEEQVHNYSKFLNDKNNVIEQNCQTITELKAWKEQQIQRIETQSSEFEKEYQYGIKNRENELQREFELLLNREVEDKNKEIFEKNQQIYSIGKQLDDKMIEIDELKQRIRVLEDNLDILEREVEIKEKIMKSSSSEMLGKLSNLQKSSVENELIMIKQYKQEIEQMQVHNKQIEEYLETQTQQNNIISDQNLELELQFEKQQILIKSLEEQKSSCLDLLTEKNILLENNQKEIQDLISQRDISLRKVESQESIIKSLEQRITDLIKSQENIYIKIKSIVDVNQLNSANLFDESEMDKLITIVDLALSRKFQNIQKFYKLFLIQSSYQKLWSSKSQYYYELSQKGAEKNIGIQNIGSSSPQFTNYDQIKLLLKYLPSSLQQLSTSQEQALIDFNQETIQDALSNKLIFNLHDYCHLIARNWVNFLKDLHSIFKNIENNVLDLQNAIDALKNFDIMGIMLVCYNQVATNFTYHQEKYDMLLTQTTNQFHASNFNNQYTQSNNNPTLQYSSNSSTGHQSNQLLNQSSASYFNDNSEIIQIRNAVKTAEKYTSKLEERVVRSNNFQQVLQDTKVIMQVLDENLQNTVQRFLNSCVELRSTPITNKKYLYSSFNSLLIEHAQDEMINIRNALKLLDLYYLNNLKLSRNVIKERGEKNNVVINQIIKKISELTKKKQHLTALINQDIDNLNIDKVINQLKDIYIYNSIPNIPLIHSNNTDKKHFLQNQIYELARENAGYKLSFNQIYMTSTRLS